MVSSSGYRRQQKWASVDSLAQYCTAVHLKLHPGRTHRAHIHSSKVQDGQQLLQEECSTSLKICNVCFYVVFHDDVQPGTLKHVGTVASLLLHKPHNSNQRQSHERRHEPADSFFSSCLGHSKQTNTLIRMYANRDIMLNVQALHPGQFVGRPGSMGQHLLQKRLRFSPERSSMGRRAHAGLAGEADSAFRGVLGSAAADGGRNGVGAAHRRAAAERQAARALPLRQNLPDFHHAVHVAGGIWWRAALLVIPARSSNSF